VGLSRWIMVVEGEVDPVVQEEWDRWYDEIHLPEIASCPGFVRSFRYKGAGESASRFLTIYELEGAGALESEEFARARGVGSFTGRVTLTTRLFEQHLAWDPVA
jgi:hypothetical protein